MINLKSLLVPAHRFVMIIGNGGATLSYITGGRFEKTWNINDFDSTSLAVFAAALDSHRRAPLSILVDMLEQSYRRESILIERGGENIEGFFRHGWYDGLDRPRRVWSALCQSRRHRLAMKKR